MDTRLEQLQAWVTTITQQTIDKIEPASADASFRRYFRIWQGEQVYIVMDAPPEKEDCQPFIDVTQRLLKTGVYVPEIFHVDLEQGFIVLSDLGSESYLDMLNKSNADSLYGAALRSLAEIQIKANVEDLPSYDEEMLRREISLFTDWLLGQYLKIELEQEEQNALNQVFNLLVESALQQPQVFVHRDYHSRNLMFINDDTHYKTPGIIDYQDAVNGPITYDAVSLLKDCYIDWPREKVVVWLNDFYTKHVLNKYSYKSFAQFLRDFDFMGVQRHLKASGIFCRLHLRDGKSGYLNDVPRTLNYITALEYNYPELNALVKLINKKVLPAWKMP